MRLEDASKANGRSLTSEIVARLERSLAYESSALTSNERAPTYEIDPEYLDEIERKAKEWGTTKTRALIRMTLEEVQRKG